MDTGFCTTEGHETKKQHGKTGLCQACYRRKRRTDARGDTPKQKPGPKPDPTKTYSRFNPESRHYAGGSVKCANGHKWEDGSYKVRSDGKKVCLSCVEGRKSDYCPAGLHLRAEFANSRGQCKECARLNARKNHLAYKYKLTLEEFDIKLFNQDYSCALCKEPLDLDNPKAINVDHDHSCCPGEYTCGDCVREILCSMCNKGLGSFRDSPELLSQAIKYLMRNR
jgi:Recombination endonuclease VII